MIYGYTLHYFIIAVINIYQIGIWANSSLLYPMAKLFAIALSIKMQLMNKLLRLCMAISVHTTGGIKLLICSLI
jgi:hypothetical protein